MNSKKSFLIILLVFVLLIAAAAVLYNIFGKTSGTDGADSGITDETKINGSAPEDKKTPAPDFKVINETGEEVSLSDFKGKPAIINFWATWCKPCTSELAAFNKLHDEYKDQVSFLMVNMTDGTSDTVDSVKEFIKENGYTFPVLFDTNQEALYTYSVYSIPQTFFIDAEGNIINAYMGAMSEELIKKYINVLTEQDS